MKWTKSEKAQTAKKKKKPEKQNYHQFSSVQFSPAVVSDTATPQTAAHQASQFITNTWSLLKLICIESVMPSNHLILCHPLLLPSLNLTASGSFQMSQLFESGGQSIAILSSNSTAGYISKENENTQKDRYTQYS